MRRACKHPLNSAKLLQQLRRRSETDCPSFRTARILSSSLEALCSLRLMQLREQIALHVFHHARLAKSPPYCPWLKRFHTLPVRLHAAIRACLRCLLPAGTALHSQFFSGNIFTPSPSCRLRSISACRANDTPTIERIINAFVPRKAFCSSALMQTLEQVSGRSPRRFK